MRGIIRNLSSVAKKASRKSGGLIKASLVAAPVSGLSIAAARRRRAAELAKIRAANLEEQQKARKSITLAKLDAARKAIAEKKSEAKAERQELAMVASNPYMDAADMLALDRARQDRMVVNAADRQAKIQNMQRIARKKAQQAKIVALRKQRALALKRRQAIQAKKAQINAPQPTRILTKGPASIASKTSALKRRIEIVEKQLAAAVRAHRNSLSMQQKFPKGGTAYNAQYQKTKAFASKSSELRKKLTDLKSRL